MRLKELADAPRLDFPEEAEYAFLLNAVSGPGAAPLELAGRIMSPEPVRPTVRHREMKAAARLFSAPHFPEAVVIDWPGITYRSRWDAYCTEDILAGAEDPGLLKGCLDDILEPILSKEDAAVVGISVSFPQQLIPAFLCAAVIRRFAPRAHIAMGGSFITGNFSGISNDRLFRLVDSFVIGDGEKALEALISNGQDIRSIPGLIFRRDGGIRCNPPADPLDFMPLPDYSGFDLDSYLLPRSLLWIPFRLSKGCSWGRCAFCRLDMISECRAPSADRAFSDIAEVVRQTGIKTISFTDDEGSPPLLAALSERIIAAGLRIYWTVSHRVEPVLDPARCRLLYRAGCRFLFLGIESLCDRILGLMRKGITVSLTERVLTNLMDAGIRVHAFMIVGFPGETEEEARDGYARLRELAGKGLIHSFNYSAFQLLPGSPVGDDPSAYGIGRRFDERPSRDIPHPSMLFEKKGMSLETMFRLEREFNNGGDLPLRQALEAGEPVKLPPHLSVERLNQVLEEGESSKLPFTEWLALDTRRQSGRAESKSTVKSV
jgi:radical SAM superfamily enzyme YgiQ (UPF0313 family)